MITGMKQSLYSNYSSILPQRHQGTKIIELCFIIAFLMHGRLKLVRKVPYSIYIHLLFGSLAQTPGPDLALKECFYIYGYRNLYKA